MLPLLGRAAAVMPLSFHSRALTSQPGADAVSCYGAQRVRRARHRSCSRKSQGVCTGQRRCFRRVSQSACSPFTMCLSCYWRPVNLMMCRVAPFKLIILDEADSLTPDAQVTSVSQFYCSCLFCRTPVLAPMLM
jgi:hypothetical protein